MPNPDLRFYIGRGERLLDPLNTGAHLLLTMDLEDQDQLRRLLPDLPLTALSRRGSPWPGPAILDAELARPVGGAGGILAIRPDGYIGFRGGVEDLPELERYARLVGLGLHPALSTAQKD